MDDVVFQGVTSDKVEAIWPFVEPLIERALFKAADGCYFAEDVKALCQSADMQLWVGYGKELELVVVTQIVPFPQKRVLNLFLVSAANGQMKKHWWHYKPYLEAFGREKGCEMVTGYGRRGWTKRYYAEDYEVIHTVWRKVL